MDSIDLQEVHDFLIEVAYKAGAKISSAEPSQAETGTKKNSADLVTETDQEVEDLVSKTLREKYPSFHFMGEETYKEGDELTDEPTFVVDPIDGTNVSGVDGFVSDLVKNESTLAWIHADGTLLGFRTSSMAIHTCAYR